MQRMQSHQTSPQAKVFLFITCILFIALFLYLFTTFSQQTKKYLAQSSPAVLQAHSTPTGQSVTPIIAYPNSVLTPGNVFTTVTVQEICQKGYSSGVRNVSVATKRQVYQEYGLSYPQKTGAYEVDHLVPLELGGSNDITNLWPEPAEPTPGFHQKDIVENYLHEQVCSDKLGLKTAQDEIRQDWYAVYKTISDPAQFNYAGK